MSRIIYQGMRRNGTTEAVVTESYDEDEAQAELYAFVERQRKNNPDHVPTAIWVRPKVATTDFELPSLPKPSERFKANGINQPHPKGWPGMDITIRDLVEDKDITHYYRNFSGVPFYPFRQGGKNYALISDKYTESAVIDLRSGEIIAREQQNPEEEGFCPVGFYVPDYYDVHDGSVLPGGEWWDPKTDEGPAGGFGFVWGCVWADDWAWKVQYLDLSRVRDGILTRSERFGYLPIVTVGEPSEFIRVSEHGTVTFAVHKDFDLMTGEER